MAKEKKTPPPRPTKAEYDGRIKKILELQLQGYARPDLLDFAMQSWGTGEGAAKDLLGAATDRLKEINNVSIQESLATIVANYWELYRAARAEANIAVASQILMQLAKLKGLEKHTIVIEDKRELEDASDEELDAIIEPTYKRISE